MRVKAGIVSLALLPLVHPVMAEELPPPELLEFLGEWDDGNGNWTDPEMWQLASGDEEGQSNEDGKDD